MSNYRRLISYIYAYEGGVKGKNIGYTKIEVRGDQCRIQVNVKKVYVGSSEIGVYLLSPGAEISLGRIFIRNGAGEFRIQVNPDNVEGSGCSMDQCYGLTIHDVDSTWQSYTTIWEDAVAQAAEIQLAGVTAENIRKKKEEEQKTDAPESPAEAENPEQPQRLLGEKELSGETLSKEELERILPVSGEIERELEKEQERMEAVAPWEETEPMEMEAESLTASQVENQQPENLPIPEPESASILEPENLAKLQELDRLEKETAARNNLWDRLQRQYTKVLAFDYDNGCEILSIKPQDIGLLPREIWVYGNNSFLLHGYYNYRHLILARLHNPQGASRYLLGVPGHYFSNEKYMASMFGFPHFVLAKKQPEDDGRFGYWYTDIRL